jgi:importin subunit alpha-1
MYGTTEQQLIGTQVVRKILSIESLPTENIDEIIEAGLVPKLIEFLDSKNSELQFESTWALTNIASGSSSQTKYVVEQGALPHLIKLLDSKNPDVREQSIWALGNIAGDGAKYRDLLLDIGFLSPLIRLLLDENERISLKQNGAWCLSNLCRGKNPLVDLNKIEPAFDVISKILSSYASNTNIISDTCWALSYLSDGANERIQQVIDKIDLKALVKLLKSESSSILTPVIRTIGNIVSGDDLQTQAILDCDLLPNLYELYNHSKSSIRKEINWSLSNIAAGNKEQIQVIYSFS